LNDVSIPAEIQVFAPSHTAILPDHTVVYVVAKMEVQPTSVYLDALSLAAVPGDVTKTSYEDTLPDEPFPRIFVIGQVLHEVALPDKKAFNVLTSEYVKDRAVQSTVQ
jgi:hypothetical protein